jgi:hypothetical protein
MSTAAISPFKESRQLDMQEAEIAEEIEKDEEEDDY